MSNSKRVSKNWKDRRLKRQPYKKERRGGRPYLYRYEIGEAAALMGVDRNVLRGRMREQDSDNAADVVGG